MKKNIGFALCIAAFSLLHCSPSNPEIGREALNFNSDWKFQLTTDSDYSTATVDDSNWRTLNLPHDWSIEGEFAKDNPATFGGGALPGGIGWYRKTFTVAEAQREKITTIEFDGIYWNSEVWINGIYLGKRPNGYISFAYDLSKYLKFGSEPNLIAVKVDNSDQPNSRWYSGSGIYRNVRLLHTHKVHIPQWGTYVTTPEVTADMAKMQVKTTISNQQEVATSVTLTTKLLNAEGKIVAQAEQNIDIDKQAKQELTQLLEVSKPRLWSPQSPAMYSVVSEVSVDGRITDVYTTPVGVRSFEFDVNKGFILNGEALKIKGVCQHHDLGCLGAAVNTRALERQLEILRDMGCNAIRTTHNPPTPELLDLCDRMGFLVMDEVFDMWKKSKTEHDYSKYWDEWHVRDLQDFLLRDRNHPSIFMWSIGNEIQEQRDSTGTHIAKELAAIVKQFDESRPITSGCNEATTSNFIIQSGVLDVIGFNYNHTKFEEFQQIFPNQKFIGTETGSALATRGQYDSPSDQVRVWPIRWDVPFTTGNPDLTCSAYDNCHVPWGSTHRDTWRLIKQNDYLSGMFYWTGFDYLGEPTPYEWPARSSYFGIIDLAGFPKDIYYMYKSEWSTENVLHLFPHWNWTEGQEVDMWVYSNCKSVELFVNNQSQGVQTNSDTTFNFVWRVKYAVGAVKAVGTLADGSTITQEIKTAGTPAKIQLTADRSVITANGTDLSFVTVEVVDADGNIVPQANQLIKFELQGDATIAGVDNGLQTSHEPFKANQRQTFNGKCLVVLQGGKTGGKIVLTAKSEGLQDAVLTIEQK